MGYLKLVVKRHVSLSFANMSNRFYVEMQCAWKMMKLVVILNSVGSVLAFSGLENLFLN